MTWPLLNAPDDDLRISDYGIGAENRAWRPSTRHQIPGSTIMCM